MTRSSVKRRFAWTTGTALGAGLLPFAPGTAGTIMGVPIHWLSADWSPLARASLWGALLALGVWASREICRETRQGDNQKIVIDEVVGFGITAWTAGRVWELMLLAFVLFRILDVLKPPPIRQVDRWSKKLAIGERGSEPRWGWAGFGVMIDDVLAALVGLVILIALQRQGWIPTP